MASLTKGEERSVELLGAFLRYVTFYYGERTRRVCWISEAILSTGNVKLIRCALEKGVIRESARDILLWLRRGFYPDACREVLLSVNRDQSALLPDWNGQEETECDCFDLQTFSLKTETVECCAECGCFLTGDLEGVEAIMQAKKAKGKRRYRVELEWIFRKLFGSELCMAALGGQNDVIELLLDRYGCSLNAPIDGAYFFEDEGVALEAAVVAAYGDHWDTVKLLLERGASAHWDNPRVMEWWLRVRHTNLINEVRTHLGEWALSA